MSPATIKLATIKLDGTLDVTKAKDLAAALLAQRGHPVTLDASAVKHLGAQCAQVLLAARKAWAHDGHSYEISRQSSAFEECLHLLGLDDAFGEQAA